MTSPTNRTGLPTTGLFCSLLAAAVVTIIGLFVVPKYSAAYASVGADLPLVTRLFVRGYPFTWVAPLVVIGVWRFWPNALRGFTLASVVGLSSLVLAIVVTIFALYLPIFGLAANV